MILSGSVDSSSVQQPAFVLGPALTTLDAMRSSCRNPCIVRSARYGFRPAEPLNGGRLLGFFSLGFFLEAGGQAIPANKTGAQS